eukprot:TRINITY_DN663_c0_g1_i4.p1 TRINITY_DN663_c0_g1~~TRINITY_DN663_c0_g1_i4.p1  ORF type:complete len:233 (-),score=16.20 TRINITY_DN663_c0_g1_i4:400-1098(-)
MKRKNNKHRRKSQNNLDQRTMQSNKITHDPLPRVSASETDPTKSKDAQRIAHNNKITMIAMISMSIILLLGLYNLFSAVFKTPGPWTFEEKVKSLSTGFWWFGMLYFCIIVSVILTRGSNKRANPLEAGDPPTLVAGNNVLKNTLEQLGVFGPNVAYWIFVISSDDDKKDVYVFLALFAVHRALYWIGYMYGAKVANPNLRFCGHIMSMNLNMMLMLRNFGVKLPLLAWDLF